MGCVPVIAIFDVGKTNKKLFLLDSDYKIVYEKSARFIETIDEDGDPCENLDSLISSVNQSVEEILKLDEFAVKAINFTSYGASLVYIDENGHPLAPLYNYLKNFPEDVKAQFEGIYGVKETLSAQTSSPDLGNLNSGLQLYRIKYQKPQLFDACKYALHLPQFLSSLITGQFYSDITSLGCHTMLWDMAQNDYHAWVKAEHLRKKLAPIFPSNQGLAILLDGKSCAVGVGLHDSSAALIPYLISFPNPFILISTGTWNINLNPFNETELTIDALRNDCLAYIQYQGKPVKASRIFAGNEHDIQLKRIADWFGHSHSLYRSMPYQPNVINELIDLKIEKPSPVILDNLITSGFAGRDLSIFSSGDQAYHQLILDLVNLQKWSTNMIIQDSKIRDLYVDGGFSKNEVFMKLLAEAFPQLTVYAASVAQATAVGAALAIHHSWNNKPIPKDLIRLKKYSSASALQIS